LFAKARELIGSARSMVAEHDAADPHTAGRVRQVVGGTLVADGLVGLENPLNGRKSRPGILGALFILGFGGLFVGGGLWISSSGADTDATTQGVITDVQRQHRAGSGSSKTCSLAAEFTVDGRRYATRSRVSSGGNCDEATGSSIEVRYNSANPAEAEIGTKPLWFGMIFVVVGALIALAGLVTLAVRAFCIMLGARLYLTGSRMVKESPAGIGDTGVVEEVRSRLLALMNSGPERATTAPNPATFMTGGVLGTWWRTVAEASRHSAQAQNPQQPGAGVVAPPVTTTTQPGWYPTADGAYVRWHDGVRWTDHVAPKVGPSGATD
jgi:hypothetical protein